MNRTSRIITVEWSTDPGDVSMARTAAMALQLAGATERVDVLRESDSLILRELQELEPENQIVAEVLRYRPTLEKLKPRRAAR